MQNRPDSEDSVQHSDEGVTRSRADAVAGDAESQFGLAFSLAASQQNYAEAAEWYFKAADQDHRLAQFNLADRYGRSSMTGSEMDVSESRIECYKWFKLAAAQGYGDALARSDSATLRMTHEEVAEGNRRVTVFGEEAKSV